MAKFKITTTARATIEETWEVEADSPYEARELLMSGGATFISERSLGEEEDREVETMELDGEDLPEGCWFEELDDAA